MAQDMQSMDAKWKEILRDMIKGDFIFKALIYKEKDTGEVMEMGETFATRLAEGTCVKCLSDDSVRCEKDCTLHTCVDCQYIQEKSLAPACYDMDLIGKESLINAYLGLNTKCDGEAFA